MFQVQVKSKIEIISDKTDGEIRSTEYDYLAVALSRPEFNTQVLIELLCNLRSVGYRQCEAVRTDKPKVEGFMMASWN